MSLISSVLVDSFVITMVAYTISMSMALIFAQKEGYEVDSNQELVAQVNLNVHPDIYIKYYIFKYNKYVYIALYALNVHYRPKIGDHIQNLRIF